MSKWHVWLILFINLGIVYFLDYDRWAKTNAILLAVTLFGLFIAPMFVTSKDKLSRYYSKYTGESIFTGSPLDWLRTILGLVALCTILSTVILGVTILWNA